jgi:tyrosine-protein phosphatase non-receptor type 14/21
MPRLFRKSQRYNVAKNSWLSRIVLLDNTAIEINLQPHVTGSDCLERVAQCMDIVEIDYFGLQYTCKDGYTRWVDRDKALRKQLDKYHIDGARNAELRFAVQFYVTNVSKLEFEITRYLYFLQLKDNIIRGDLKCSNEIACKLASYALQAEFGDYDETKHTQEFLDDCILFPSYMTLDESLYEKVSRLHQRHRTMSAATAELAYIKLAQQLIEYGHEPLQQLEVNGMRIWIGACFIGIFIKHGNGQPTVYFKWPEILRMKVKDRSFAVETQQETVYFKMLDTQTAEYILRMMVHQHMFYQTEYQGLNVKWNAMKSKRKSASLHDVSSISVKSDRKEGGSLRKHDRGMKFSRPLGQPGQRESILEPLTPTHVKLEENPFPPSLEVHSGAVSDSNHRLTPVAWQEKEPEENKKAKEKGLNRTAIIEKIPVEEDNIDIGQPLTSSDIKKTLETAQPSNFGTYPRDSPRSNGLPPTHHQFTSSNIEGSGGSQESFELSHARNEHLKGI